MKKQYILITILLMIFSACDGDLETEETSTENEELVSKSEIYNEVIVKASGDFNGSEIGMSLSDVKELFDNSNLSEEAEDFIQYKVSDTYTISEYSFIFEDEKLSQIAFDTDVYDSADNKDAEAALVLFNDLKDTFLKKFGSKYLDNVNENSIRLFWTKDNKEIQLIKNFSEVHVYIDLIVE